MPKKRRINWTAVSMVCVGLGFVFVLGAALFVVLGESPQSGLFADPAALRPDRADGDNQAAQGEADRAAQGSLPTEEGVERPRQTTERQNPSPDFAVVPVVVPEEQVEPVPVAAPSLSITIAVLPPAPGSTAVAYVIGPGGTAVPGAIAAPGATAVPGTVPVPGATALPGTVPVPGAAPTAEATATTTAGTATAPTTATTDDVDDATEEQSPVPGAEMGFTYCGTRTCNVGFKCCCSVCTPFEQACDPAACSAWAGLSVSVACGMDLCDPGEVCCDPRCGACATSGQCPEAPCD